MLILLSIVLEGEKHSVNLHDKSSLLVVLLAGFKEIPLLWLFANYFLLYYHFPEPSGKSANRRVLKLCCNSKKHTNEKLDLDVACRQTRIPLSELFFMLLVKFTRSAETNGEKYQIQREVLEGMQS